MSIEMLCMLFLIELKWEWYANNIHHTFVWIGKYHFDKKKYNYIEGRYPGRICYSFDF